MEYRQSTINKPFSNNRNQHNLPRYRDIQFDLVPENLLLHSDMVLMIRLKQNDYH